MKRKFSLRLKLTLSGVGLLGVLWGISSYSTSRIVDATLKVQLHELGNLLGPIVHSAIYAPLLQRDYATLEGILAEIGNHPEIAYVEVFDTGHRLLARSKSVPTTRPQSPSTMTDFHHVEAFSSDIVLAGQALGSVKFGISSQSIEIARQNILRQVYGVGFAALILVSLLLWWFSAVIIKPLTSLALAARNIRAGNYDIALPRARRDEIGMLIEAFKVMTIEINRRIKELVHSEALQRRYLRDAIQKQKELQKALIATKEADRAKTEFLANMSHEIRTPLNGVLGMLQLLFKSELSEKERELARKSYSAARLLLHVLNDILDYSKIDAGMLVVDPRPFNLDSVLQEVFDLLEVGAQQKSLTMELQREGTQIWVLGDGDRLRQILLNLGANAIKFTKQGSVCISAAVEQLAPDELTLHFSVKDTGIGIAANQLQNIFKSFTQAESSTTRRYGGSGLGLSISQGLAQLMGSTIEAHSTLGQGSTFSFTLNLPRSSAPPNAIETRPMPLDLLELDTATPRNGTPSSVVPAPQLPTTSDFIDGPLRGLRILAIEDSELNQEAIKGILESEGAEVDLANNGKLGLERIATIQVAYDVVLMDIQMPVMDGFTATKILRRMPKFRHLPIIAMTANAMASDRAECLHIGMNDYISKPYNGQEVVAKVLGVIQANGNQKINQPTNHTKPNSIVIESVSPDRQPFDVKTKQLHTLARQRGLDLSTALERMGNNVSLYRRLLERFVDAVILVPEQLDGYRSNHQRDEAQRLLHTFKGSAGMMGLMALSAQFEQLERLLKGGKDDALNATTTDTVRTAIDQSVKTARSILLALEDSKPPQPAPAVTGVVDLATFRKKMKTLMDQLQQSNMQAMNTYDDLEKNHANQLGGLQVMLQAAIEKLQFSAAITICEDILAVNESPSNSLE